MHVIPHLLPSLNVIFVQSFIVEAYFFLMFMAFGEYRADSGDFFRATTQRCNFTKLTERRNFNVRWPP